MSAPSVMEVLNQLALEARLFRTAKSTNDADFDQQGANAIAAVAELVAAVKHDFDTRRRVPLAGPQDLQDATDRVAAALVAMGEGA